MYHVGGGCLVWPPLSLKSPCRLPILCAGLRPNVPCCTAKAYWELLEAASGLCQFHNLAGPRMPVYANWKTQVLLVSSPRHFEANKGQWSGLWAGDSQEGFVVWQEAWGAHQIVTHQWVLVGLNHNPVVSSACIIFLFISSSDGYWSMA